MPGAPFTLRVARLTKAHGLKGGIKLEIYTDEPDQRFVPGAVFALQVPQSSPWFGKHLTLRELRWYNTNPVAFFEEIPDRTAAETVIKAILLIQRDRDELPDEPDAWYDHQLVGLEVWRDGARIGEVARVDHLPAQDLLIVQVGEAEVMLPFVHQFVPEIDLEQRRMTITPPLGLFEQLPDDAAE